jgi:hypothetical protein
VADVGPFKVTFSYKSHLLALLAPLVKRKVTYGTKGDFC